VQPEQLIFKIQPVREDSENIQREESKSEVQSGFGEIGRFDVKKAHMASELSSHHTETMLHPRPIQDLQKR
jgi:hypothetical protein